MDASGGAYGEDPYGDAGHAYAYGYEYGGSVGTDTGTMSWDSVELAQWTHSEYSTHATGTDPHATGTHPYGAGPYPATTAAWGSPHGDVLTLPPPEFDTGAPVPEPETPANESVRPVFVDSSGRRRRRVLRAGRLLVIPAGGYVALLISTLLADPASVLRSSRSRTPRTRPRPPLPPPSPPSPARVVPTARPDIP
ncbi:hypothetical protein [Streptomyces mirabilis]|uniref:hypothetical protein n=1 Tax=Streptomyces mirabilis TaxID=68239 RepID=UPI0036A7D775